MKTNSALKHVLSLAFLVGLAVFGGCATRAPTIAHVHVGHAITGASDTPRKVGYFVVAEQRAGEAHQAAVAATSSQTLEAAQAALARVNEITNTRDDFALVEAITSAAGHIDFAATSDDASQNIVQSSAQFRERIEGVVHRGNLIKLYAADALSSNSMSEVDQLRKEILRLAHANVYGDSTEVGNRGFGVQQLRSELDAMVAREDPPYTTVERWYLFNLIRLPNGDWRYRSSRDGGGGSVY